MNRTRDLLACSIVPQPTTLPCAPNIQGVPGGMCQTSGGCIVTRFLRRLISVTNKFGEVGGMRIVPGEAPKCPEKTHSYTTTTNPT
jgi:hypothetical protein